MMFTDFPQELESEILVRVPATSLTQLRSTCKRWYALFKDPRFIEKNKGKAARQFILKKDDGVYSVRIDLHNRFDFTGKLTTLEDSKQVVISTIYQCDGLLLYTINSNRYLVNKLVVWNPCTGQTRWIQPSDRNREHDRYFLGYENNNKPCQCYKILRSSVGELDEFELYDFNSDSWRLLDGVTHIWFIRSHGVSLKGNIYWVAWDRKKPFTSKFILRFDFKREVFERVSLPFLVDYFEGIFDLSVVREEKLSVLYQTFSNDSFEVKIWVTDTEIDEAEDACIKYLSVVDFSESWSTCIMTRQLIESFLVDEKNNKAVCCGRDWRNSNKIIVYIIGGDQNLHVCKQVHGDLAQGQFDYWQPPRGSDYWNNIRPDDYKDLLVSYVPSLLQIP